MRLRKTYQGRLPDNKILNNVSNSTTDTYSCKQINEMLIFEEEDPTVPEHVKNISEQDIKRWDEGTGGVVEESDPTVPAHVKAITQEDIDNWNSGTGGGGGTGATTDFNTNWVNAELTADFKLYNDASYCRYAKVGNLVNIQFVLSPASEDNVLNSYAETTAFVLPEEYRPSQNLNVLCQGTNLNVYSVGINTSGNVYLHRYRSGDSLSSTPPAPGVWLPCNITYMIDNGALIVGGANAGGLSVDQVYPIGSVFISTVDQNPGNIFLGTSWERFATGRTLVGVDTSDEDFATAGQVGGHKSLQNHTHTISSSGAHKHETVGRTSSGSTTPSIFESLAGAGGTRAVNVPRSGTNGAHTHTVNATGDGDSGNLQPYITVFMWVRTA